MGKPRPRFNFDPSVVTPTSSAPMPTPEVVPEADPREATQGTRSSTRAPSREGKKGVTFYLPPAAWKQLKMLSVQRDRPVQDLMLDAVDLLFAQHGQHRLARE